MKKSGNNAYRSTLKAGVSVTVLKRQQNTTD